MAKRVIHLPMPALQRRYLLKVKIARVKLSNLDQLVPVLDRQHAIAKVYASGGAQLLECAIHRGNRHAQRLAQLNKVKR